MAVRHHIAARAETLRDRAHLGSGWPELRGRARELLDDARARLLLVEDVPDGWRWPEVRDIAREFGAGIPLRAAVPDEAASVSADTAVAYDVLHSEVVVFEDRVLGFGSAAYFAGVLPHELTHAVFERAVHDVSGLDRAELHTWLSSCSDDLGFRVITEALAIANEAAFVAAADGDELLAAHPGAGLLLPALDWATGAVRLTGSRPWCSASPRRTRGARVRRHGRT